MPPSRPIGCPRCHDLPPSRPLFASKRITSIWTDFKDAYDGKTLITSYPTGAGPAGWTSSGTLGFATDIVSNGGAISGQALRVRGSSGTGNSGSLTWDYVGSVFDAEILMGVYVDVTGGTLASRQIGSIMRTTDPSHLAVLGLFDSVSHDDIELSTFGSGTGGTTVPFAWPLDTWLWMRMQAIGNNYKMKVWTKASAEPSSWSATWTDSILTVAGALGVSGSSRASALIYCDFFSVSIDGSPAYGPGL